jgi:hypothetical protein
MKKTGLIFLMLLLSIIEAMGQDIIDPPKLFNKNTLDIYDRRSQKFTLGWNWGGPGRALDQALFINTYHNMPVTYSQNSENGYSEEVGDSIGAIDVIKNPVSGAHLTGRIDTLLLNGISLYLEPTLPVTNATINDSKFKPRWNDYLGGVYGFKYRNTTVGDTLATGNDYSRFVLRASRISSPPVTVLDSVHDGSIIRYLDF